MDKLESIQDFKSYPPQIQNRTLTISTEIFISFLDNNMLRGKLLITPQEFMLKKEESVYIFFSNKKYDKLYRFPWILC